MSERIERMSLKGFKTIDSLQNFDPCSLTILIGPNGVGKSNFISFFQMLNRAMTDPGNLQLYVAQEGGANAILHGGSAGPREIEAEIVLRYGCIKFKYAFRLVFAAADTLVYAEERTQDSSDTYQGSATWQALGAGHRESSMVEIHSGGARGVFRAFLQDNFIYQFHDTSNSARIRGKWTVHDYHRLREDGANIASVLLHLREHYSYHYHRIVETVRLILPFYSDFELWVDYGSIVLGWRERNSDQVFNAAQASDGMLRIMALVTLLLQPILPGVLILDEPELGLHPHAINVVGSLIGAAATRTQVIVATQSTTLVDCFEPEDIVVVEREDNRSVFKRLEADALMDWLEDYSLSELWEKNVIGGRP